MCYMRVFCEGFQGSNYPPACDEWCGGLWKSAHDVMQSKCGVIISYCVSNVSNFHQEMRKPCNAHSLFRLPRSIAKVAIYLFPDPPTPSPASLSWPSCSEAISAVAAVLKTNQQLMMQLLSAQLYLVTWDSQPVPGVPSLPYIWLNK